MTEDNFPEESELDTLKTRAEQMGIKHHPSIGIDALRSKIDERLVNVESEKPELTAVPSQKTSALELKKKAGELVRIRVASMNPAKREWEGEIFSVGNGVVGTFKKYVPFDIEWHVPRIILNMIKARKCQTFFTEVDKRTGNKTRKGRMISEFAIEILEPLTQKEIQDLAQRQAMANGTAA
jgi:hypothetical protein